jgi:hypothetical protein
LLRKRNEERGARNEERRKKDLAPESRAKGGRIYNYQYHLPTFYEYFTSIIAEKGKKRITTDATFRYSQSQIIPCCLLQNASYNLPPPLPPPTHSLRSCHSVEHFKCSPLDGTIHFSTLRLDNNPTNAIRIRPWTVAVLITHSLELIQLQPVINKKSITHLAHSLSPKADADDKPINYYASQGLSQPETSAQKERLDLYRSRPGSAP